MNFEAMMEQLRSEYVHDLPGKIADIESSLKSMAHSLLVEDFHKLKGTGKTYGIPEISLLAEVLEHICSERPQAIPKAVPLAVSLLREIHQRRTSAQAFDIDLDQRFASLKTLMS